jgi:hypothetical protein
MLSSPAATGSKGERLALGRRPIGCVTQPDLVSARARETSKRLHRGAVFTEPVFWNPSPHYSRVEAVGCQNSSQSFGTCRFAGKTN